MRRILLGVCLLFLTACLENSPTSPTPVDRQVVLAPGGSVEVASRLSVRFLEVLGDSRCPADAMCVTGGDAIVRIDIAVGDTRVERDLHTGNNQPVLHEGVKVDLVQLDAYPFSTRPIQPDDYRATLRVTR